MQAILLVTVFSCLLGAANVDAVAFGADCTAPATCDDAHNECSAATSKCVCVSGYTVVNGVCIAEHTIGTTCISTDGSKGDCSDDNAICPTGTKKCECKSGYKGTTGGTCAVNNKGSAPAQMSMWMLCMTVIGMSLAVYVV